MASTASALASNQPAHQDSAPVDDLDRLLDFDDAELNQGNAGERNNARREPESTETGLGIDEEIKVRKPRAPIAKLDEDRLLSAKGIPRLRRITKDHLKFRGKGHEVCSLV